MLFPKVALYLHPRYNIPKIIAREASDSKELGHPGCVDPEYKSCLEQEYFVWLRVITGVHTGVPDRD